MRRGIKLVLSLILLTFSIRVAAQEKFDAITKRDSPVFQQRVQLLVSADVAGLEGLRARYRFVRLQQVPILPPEPTLVINMRMGYASYRKRAFPRDFWKELKPVSMNGVDVYPVTVAEDRTTRVTLFYNAAGQLIGSLAPEPGYDPYAWLREPGSDFFTIVRTRDELEWELALKDPARVTTTFNLVPYNRIVDLVEATMTTVTTANTPAPAEGRMMSMAVESLTSIVIRAITPSTNGMVLDIAWPEGFTNRLEILARSSVGPAGWTPLPPAFQTDGISSCLWTDRVSSLQQPRFYSVGNADWDSDLDGLCDARETRVYGTDAAAADTDGDGLIDGRELLLQFSDPLVPDTDGDTLGDGSEAFGWGAWDVRSSNGCDWVSPGSSAVWINDWQPEQVSEGRVDSGFSAPIAAPLILGTRTGATFQVAVDGYILIDSDLAAGTPSDGLNKPLPCPAMADVIAPFWDDLRVSPSNGIWVQVSGTGSAMRVVVTWSGAEVERASGLNEGLDIQCEYVSATRSYLYRYRPAQGRLFPVPSACTVGIQGSTPGSLARVSFNGAGSPVADTTIRLSPALTKPRLTDTDNDAWADDIEALLGMNPVVAEDTEGDDDGDGLPNGGELEQGTDPVTIDTDGDGFSDAEEVFWHMDPLSPCDPDGDEDGDGLSNWDEWMHRSNPLQADTDGDGASDWLEVDQGSDPLDFSDFGMAPEDTMEVMVELRTGDALLQPAAAMRQPATAAVQDGILPETHGTVFKIGNIRFRCRPGSGGSGIGRFRLSKGRTYDVVIYHLDGQVQELPVWSTIEIDGFPPVPIPGQPRWICGSAVIDNPAASLGERSVTLSEGKAAHSTLRSFDMVLQGPNGETPPQADWPLGSQVPLSAVISPSLGGSYTWTTDPDSVPIDADGSNAVAHVDAAITVTVAFTPEGASAPMLTCSAPLRPIGHICTWGSLVMTMPPEIPCNLNDSDFDGNPDREQSPPPDEDPDLRLCSLYHDREGVLACCRQRYSGAKVTLSRLTGASRIRMWNIAGTLPYQMPFEEPLMDGVWNFRLEGVEWSDNPLDVALEADVSFDNEPGLFRIWRTTVLRVSILRPAGSADNNPNRKTNFVMDEGAPYRYDWQAVVDSPVGNGSLPQPEGLLYGASVYDYSWTIDPGCGTLERAGHPLPIHFPPSGITGVTHDGTLKLEALRNGQSTGVFDSRKVRIYDDHLRRDMENFTPENLVPFNSLLGVMEGATRYLGFTSFHSTSHANNGMANDSSWELWNCATSIIVNATNYPAPLFSGIQRGDVVLYFANDTFIHSQTCTGNGSETWGANNVPLQWNGTAYTNAEWTFATAPAGVHYQNARPDLFPIEIILLKKPR